MDDWLIALTETYQCKHEHYERKHPRELAAMEGNLDTYFKALKVNNPLQIKAGFIHPESDGIKAIDQKCGRQKVKLQQARLYIYPDVPTKTLFLLTIGDKQTQRDDIKYCREHVKKEIRKETKG